MLAQLRFITFHIHLHIIYYRDFRLKKKNNQRKKKKNEKRKT